MSQPEILRWDQAYNRNGDGKLPRAVVNVIRTYMNNHTVAGWVSQETLMRDTGLSESQVRRQIKANVEAGWLVVVRQGRAGRATEYRLTYSQPAIDDRLDDPTPNRSRMTGYTPQPVIDDRLQPVMDDTPTSPGTSPQEKFLGAVEGSEATEGVADGRGQVDPSREAASDEAAEYRPDGLQSATAAGSRYEDPFAVEPAWLVESRARERAARLQPATAGDRWASPWD